MSLEKIIEIAHKIADPYVKSAEAWKSACILLAVLLALSVCANVYLVTRNVGIIVEQDYQHSDHNTNDIG